MYHSSFASTVLFADFGKDVYGKLRIEFSSAPPVGTVNMHLGEKLGRDGAIIQWRHERLTFGETMAFLDVSKATLNRWAKQGKLTPLTDLMASSSGLRGMSWSGYKTNNASGREKMTLVGTLHDMLEASNAT